MVVVLVGRRSVREISRCIFRWEGELGSKDDGDKPAVWLSQASMSRCTCQVGLLRSRWFGGCGGVVSPKHDGGHRCRNRIAAVVSLVAAPAIVRLCGLSSILPRPNGFLLCKSLSTTTYTTALLLSRDCRATSHHSSKATLPRFAYHPS
jgi:hypothetical protein